MTENEFKEAIKASNKENNITSFDYWLRDKIDNLDDVIYDKHNPKESIKQAKMYKNLLEEVRNAYYESKGV